MSNSEFDNKEPKKEKNIKHGIIALASIIIAIILIIIGIYLYGQYHVSKEDIKPVKLSQTTSS